MQAAKERRVTVEFRPRQMVAELAGAGVHQGIVAIAGWFRYAELGELLDAANEAHEPALIVLLDGITDPHNLGAIARSAEVLGAHGLVIPARGSASVTPGAVKASAGATERVPHRRGRQPAEGDRHAARFGRARAGRRRRRGRAPGRHRLQAADRDRRRARRARGCARPSSRRCDGQFHIPQRGTVSSLNASVAAAIALYEAARQRGSADR